jgi:hypothetical protein
MTTPRHRCLELARGCITQRADAYGRPKEFYERVAKRWSLTLNTPVSAREVLLCLLDMKQERALANPGHTDSVVDIAGYAACLYEVDGGDR